MPERNSFTFRLTAEQQTALVEILAAGNYMPAQVPHTIAAARTDACTINLYQSGKCLVQGKGAEDFVTFVLEPLVLQRAAVGYEEVLDPDASKPHMGVDESGKGDFFGPLVVVAAYADADLARTMRRMNVRDSKQITSDDKALEMGRDLRRLLDRRHSVVRIGPEAYNRLYSRMRNVNTMLAWAHARAIENLLEMVPDCPKAISDQFGRKEQVEQALMKRGRRIELIQQPRAESDIAVAAASVIARDLFLRGLKDMAQVHGQSFPKGASPAVRGAAVDLVRREGPRILLSTAKCHFKTTDEVLATAGAKRADLGAEGAATSKPVTRWPRKASGARVP